ncbi:MAG: hypothetical protein JXR70_05880 [Spirochaetales bacterium]|nr:hypothetical protein [Spirochaetales bacterium]
MSVIFSLRLFDYDKYIQIFPTLKMIAKNKITNNDKVKKIIEEALHVTTSPEFSFYNHDFSIVEDWPQLLKGFIQELHSFNKINLTLETANEYIECIIALLCMPKFQFYYTSLTTNISENYIALGRFDGRLLGQLQKNTNWFNKIFEWDFPFDRPDFKYGDAMALFTPTQLMECEKELKALSNFFSDNEKVRYHYNRLYRLVTKVTENTSTYRIVLCEE